MSPGAAAGAGSRGEDDFLRTFPAIVKEECMELLLGLNVCVSDCSTTPCRGRRHANGVVLPPLQTVGGVILHRFQTSLWRQVVQFAVWFVSFWKGRVLILLDPNLFYHI